MKKIVIFYLVSISTALSVYAGNFSRHLESGIGLGYRKDQIHFETFQNGELKYREKDQDLRGLAFDAFLNLRLLGLWFNSHLDFAWFLSGNMHNHVMPLAGSSLTDGYSFRQKTSGWATDFRECMGYRFDLYQTTQSVSLMPQVGYGCSYQQLTREGNSPTFYSFDRSVVSYDASVARFHQQWWGPLVGGALIYSPIQSWTFELSYFYYFMDLKEKWGALEYLDDAHNASLGFVRSVENELRGDKAMGQSVHGSIRGQIANHWNMNLLFNYFRFSEDKDRVVSKQQVKQYFPRTKAFSTNHKLAWNALWQSFSFLCEVEYFF